MKYQPPYKATIQTYKIYYGDREYAREFGDPCLGIIDATSKTEAERKADRRSWGRPGAGLWAITQLREE